MQRGAHGIDPEQYLDEILRVLRNIVAADSRAFKLGSAQRLHYNNARPHSSLDGITPTEFMSKFTKPKSATREASL